LVALRENISLRGNSKKPAGHGRTFGELSNPACHVLLPGCLEVLTASPAAGIGPDAWLSDARPGRSSSVWRHRPTVSRLYFATPLRQKDTNQATWGKLFQVTASNLSVAEGAPVPGFRIHRPPGYATGSLFTRIRPILTIFGEPMCPPTARCVPWQAGEGAHPAVCTATRSRITTPPLPLAHDPPTIPAFFVLAATGSGPLARAVTDRPKRAPDGPYLVNLKTGEQTNLPNPRSDRPDRCFDVGEGGGGRRHRGVLDEAACTTAYGFFGAIPIQAGM